MCTLMCAMSQTTYGELPLTQLQSKANAGDATAQVVLGGRYYNGKGVTKSYTEAVKWFRKAAEQGDADAQCLLGHCFYFGEGVTQSSTEAVKWYRKAAEQGHKGAQYNLGVCYKKGEGVTQSYTEAAKWFRKAAEQGHKGAQYYLGLCYYKGEGVTQSYTEAVKWYRKAAEQGDAGAQLRLGVCYDNGEGVTQSYTEAAKWFRKAAEQGDAEAQLRLGVCYCYGEGVTQSYTEAAKWYRKAAEQGEDLGEVKLKLAKNGLALCEAGIKEEESMAAESSRSTAQQGNTSTPSSSTSTSTSSTYSGSTSGTYTGSTSSTYTGSSYTPSSTYKYRSHRKTEDLDWVGLSLGYVQKRWRYYEDGEVDDVGMFDEQKLLNGVQVGLTFSPKFVAGFGIQTGLFYEYFYAKSSEYYDDYDYPTRNTYNEHNLYVPFHLKYDFNLGSKIYLGLFGGVGIDCIVVGKVKWVDTYYDDTYYEESVLDICDQKRFNASWEVGGTFRYRNFQLGYTYSRGLMNHSYDPAYEVKQNKPMRLNMTLFF